MSESFAKKSSNFFITLLIAVITMTFMFSGMDLFKGVSSDTVAKVGSKEIKLLEFSQHLDQEISQQRKMWPQDSEIPKAFMGRIKQMVLDRLILIAVYSQFSEEVFGPPSDNEIKDSIKKIPAFMANGKFNLDQYKKVLQANRYSMGDFEKRFQEDLAKSMGYEALSKYPISKRFAQDISSFKNEKLILKAVEVNKGSLDQFIPVSNEEINAFITDSSHSTNIEGIFEGKKSQWDKPKQVKARHILLKSSGDDESVKKRIEEIAKQTTPTNFISMAQKYTEEPGGKEKGGDLGFFSKGRMVPEFEKMAFSLKEGEVSTPIKTMFGYHLILVEKIKEAKQAKLEDHKKEIAKGLLQKQKTKKLDELISDLKSQLETAMKKGDDSTINNLVKKYSLSLKNEININKYDGNQGALNIEEKSFEKIWSEHKDEDNFLFENPARITFIKVLPAKKSSNEKPLEEEQKMVEYTYTDKFQKEMIEYLKKKYAAKIVRSEVLN